MSVETEDSNTELRNAVETEAREMGWVPKDEFKGDETKWIDADSFVEHGRKVMPILRKNNSRLIQDQQGMKQQLAELTAQLKSAREDFSTLQEYHNEEIVRRVEDTRKQLLTQIKAAHQEGNTDVAVDLTDQLTQLNAASAATEVGADEDEGAKANGKDVPQYHPAFLAWQSANASWFGAPGHEAKSNLAMSVAYALKAEQPTLLGAEFYVELDKRLAEQAAPRPRTSKVAASAGGAGRGGGNGRTYGDLPAEAKAECDKAAKQFVRENGRFPTVAAYRTHFIEQLEKQGYFQ